MNETQAFVDLQDAGNAQAQLILQAIARHADWDTGACHPGESAIARMAKCSERTVRRYLKQLEADGFITRHPRHDADNQRLTDVIVLVGFSEWITALRDGGKVPKPRAISPYADTSEHGQTPPDNLTGGKSHRTKKGVPPDRIPVTTGQQASGGNELSERKNQLRACAPARDAAGAPALICITRATEPTAIALWRAYALHREGREFRAIVRLIDTHGAVSVPSLYPPDEKSKLEPRKDIA